MKDCYDMVTLTEFPQWKKLEAHYKTIASLHMRDLFSQDPIRSETFFLEAAGLSLDYSKNRITLETRSLLCELAKALKVPEQIEFLFRGELVNSTERMAALHTALRNSGDEPVYFDGIDVMPAIRANLDKIEKFSEDVRSGAYKGFTGKPISDVVNIGVGGSDLGPLMVYRALMPYKKAGLRCHFVSNQDEFHIDETLKNLNPDTTLFIITSKSFLTKETIDNAAYAKQWFKNFFESEEAVAHHFLAVTACAEKAKSFGIKGDNIFPMWPWVGGRYSIWSSVGLVIAIAIGMDRFREFLRGAYEMDEHFKKKELSQNMPVLLGLLTVWYNNFFKAQSRAIIPYSQQLRYFPDYLKQLHMESLGKSIQRDGDPVDYPTGMVVWGGVGSNSQHSFHQLFLQGNKLSPIDFILPLKRYNANNFQYDLISNCLSQREILMAGYDLQQVIEDLREQGISEKDAAWLAPHKAILGNYPSNLIFMEQLTPKTLGALIALYEHKIYVQCLVWNINAFDQWGVEKGKKMARSIAEKLKKEPFLNSNKLATY